MPQIDSAQAMRLRERARGRKYYAANRESRLAYQVIHYAAHRERRLAYQNAYYAANAAKISASRAGSASISEYHRKYHAANAERVAENGRAWKRAHPEAGVAKDAARRARKLGAEGVATAAEIAARWTYFGDKCWVCGGVATATDHVKPLAKGGSNWPANLRPVCGSCNSSKGATWPLRRAA